MTVALNIIGVIVYLVLGVVFVRSVNRWLLPPDPDNNAGPAVETIAMATGVLLWPVFAAVAVLWFGACAIAWTATGDWKVKR